MCATTVSMIRRWLLLLSLAAPLAAGCAAETSVDESGVDSVEEPLTRVTESEQRAAQAHGLDGLTFQRLTPTSTKILSATRYWIDAQDEDARYPKPRMCATNVSKVLFLGGITRYDQEGVRVMLRDVSNAGGLMVKLPQNKAGLIASLNTTFNKGVIPAGTLVAGLNVNTSRPGDQHIGVIGNVDANGTIWIYHNNWYRPENEGGVRKPHMISDANIRRGFMRQWMATPWLTLKRDAAGKITDVKSELPALDDMDPLNANYQVTLAIIPEVKRELR
jgi:hypothetical protein